MHRMSPQRLLCCSPEGVLMYVFFIRQLLCSYLTLVFWGGELTQTRLLHSRKRQTVVLNWSESRGHQSKVPLGDRNQVGFLLAAYLRWKAESKWEAIAKKKLGEGRWYLPSMNSLPPALPPLFPNSWLVESSYKNSTPSIAKSWKTLIDVSSFVCNNALSRSTSSGWLPSCDDAPSLLPLNPGWPFGNLIIAFFDFNWLKSSTLCWPWPAECIAIFIRLVFVFSGSCALRSLSVIVTCRGRLPKLPPSLLL